jgi:hypothetical protein
MPGMCAHILGAEVILTEQEELIAGTIVTAVVTHFSYLFLPPRAAFFVPQAST